MTLYFKKDSVKGLHLYFSLGYGKKNSHMVIITKTENHKE